MKLSQYIRKEIKDGRRYFEIGLESDGKTINENSKNRVKFVVKKLGEKQQIYK